MSKTWLIGLVVILLGGGAILWSQYGEKEAPTPVVTSPAPAPTPAPTATTPAPEPTLEERADAAAKAAKAEADRLAAQAEVAAKAAADAAQAQADRLAAAAEKAARDAAAAAERETARLAAEAEQAAKGAAAAAEREAARLATEAEQAAKAAKAAAGTLSEQAGQAARDAGQAIQGGARAIADEAAKAAKDAADAASRAIDGAPSAPVTPAPAPTPALAPVAPAEKDAMRAPDGTEKDAARAAAESLTPSTPGGSGPAGTGAAGPLAAVDPIPQAAGDAAGKRDSIGGDSAQSPGQAPAAPDRDRPRFDVAQVDPAGGAVIAGSARPGARVQVKDQAGAVLGEGASDPSGAFAIVVDKPLPEGDSALTLEATDSDGTVRASEETVVVSRNGVGAPALVVAQADDAGRPARVLQQPKPDAGQKASGGAGAGDKPAAGAPSSERIKTRDDALSVSSIDYDEKGSLSIAGEAQPGAEVTVDVDGKEVAQATAGADGAWQASAPPGSLPRGGVGRIGAQSGQAGQGQGGSALRVLRVVLPFAPAGLIQDFPRGRMVVVQPGNSLWRIARRTYGSGIRYSIIYAANRDQIRDADLIYPGQIFHAPTPREG